MFLFEIGLFVLKGTPEWSVLVISSSSISPSVQGHEGHRQGRDRRIRGDSGRASARWQCRGCRSNRQRAAWCCRW